MIRLGVFVAVFFFLTQGLCLYAMAAEDHASKLIEGAKKEGKLVVYTSMNVRDATLLLQEFKKRYPFIETELYRSNSQKLLPRIEVEARTKKHQADAITASFPIWNELTKKGLVARYQSPESQRYPQELKDAQGYWTILYLQVMGMAYNTKLVLTGSAPKRYEDLLSPKWKKKEIAMDYRDNTWFAVMLEIMGESEGLTFMKRLSEKDLYLRENKTLLTQLLAAGEFLVLANTYVDSAMEFKRAGAPIEWLPGRDPIPASTHLVGVYSYASHPNAARLYVDFLLSKEGQGILTGKVIGKFPANPEVESDLRPTLKGSRLHPIDPTMAARFDRLAKQFEETFWK